ncbi:MAG: 23S rRNA (pseudouridine(1915)-N(3))-methyltransferase RlmH [Bacteroidales bacterium]|nr:23S rRNA (pseudouridine(1915)-N(3))-methyltransferase RlmH [Bacteroidales bacterium]
MKITFLVIGKTNDKYLIEGIDIFEKRLKHYINIGFVVIPEIKKNSSGNIEQLKINEGKEIIKKINKSDYIVLLDERGKQMRSEEFANFIIQKQNASVKNLIFIVGGAYGFSEEVYKRADFLLSLSLMTFSHQMVRLFFMEQLYRAFTIIKNESYHHK